MNRKVNFRIKALLLSLFIFLSGVGINQLNAYAATGFETVYITKTGSCYHSANCSSLKKSKIESTLQDAVNMGLKPCSKCHPPILDANVVSQKTESSLSDKSVNAEKVIKNESMVWLSASGKKYHSKNDCGNMNPEKAVQITEAEAVAKGIDRCSKCWK